MPIRAHYLRAAIGLIDSELHLLDKRLAHPEQFKPMLTTVALSPLHWNGTSTELAELLCALDACGAIRYADGRKASFTELVTEVGRLFNIRLGEPHDLKRNVLRRKIRLTVFTDKLRRLLIEYSAEF